MLLRFLISLFYLLMVIALLQGLWFITLGFYVVGILESLLATGIALLLFPMARRDWHS